MNFTPYHEKAMSAERFNRLIRKVKNDRAFTTLFDFYYPRIKLYFIRNYHSKDLGEDVAQIFFAKILTMEFVKKIEHPNAWVYTNCRNIANDLLTDDRCSKPSEENITAATDTSWRVYEKLYFDDYMKQLNELDAETKNIIIKYGYEGYTLREIADEMGMNYNTVRQKYNRGRKKIKK